MTTLDLISLTWHSTKRGTVIASQTSIVISGVNDRSCICLPNILWASETPKGGAYFKIGNGLIGANSLKIIHRKDDQTLSTHHCTVETVLDVIQSLPITIRDEAMARGRFKVKRDSKLEQVLINR